MDTEHLLLLNNEETFTYNEFSEDFTNILTSYVEIHRHVQEIEQLFHVFQFNIESLLDNYIIYNNDQIERKINFNSEHSNFIAINSFVMNIISAGRIVVDATETCIVNAYDSNSKCYIDFNKDYKKRIYENNFSYRFFYSMRNFSQHQHLLISVKDDFCCFDIWQILNTPHFKMNKLISKELHELMDKVIEKHGDVFRLSLCMCLAEYTVGVSEVYLGFWKSIKEKLFELNHSIIKFVKENPDILDHNNEKYNGNIIYKLPNEEGVHLFNPYNDIESYYNNCLSEAKNYYDKNKKEYNSLKEFCKI